MSSTPSASALNAVLRCRGNVWTRNPPSMRPAASEYSLGLGGGAQRDSQTERTRSNQAPAREAFAQGDRVAVGRRIVAQKSPRVDVSAARRTTFRELSQSAGHAQNALVRQLARRRIPKLPGVDACSKITQIIQCDICPDTCKSAFLREAGGFPGGAFKVSIMSSRLVEHAGQLLDTLNSACSSLAGLVSGVMSLWRPSSCREGASRHLLCQQREKIIKHNLQQANRHSSAVLTSPKGDPSCRQKITEDRPD